MVRTMKLSEILELFIGNDNQLLKPTPCRASISRISCLKGSFENNPARVLCSAESKILEEFLFHERLTFKMMRSFYAM